MEIFIRRFWLPSGEPLALAAEQRSPARGSFASCQRALGTLSRAASRRASYRRRGGEELNVGEFGSFLSSRIGSRSARTAGLSGAPRRHVAMRADPRPAGSRTRATRSHAKHPAGPRAPARSTSHRRGAHPTGGGGKELRVGAFGSFSSSQAKCEARSERAERASEVPSAERLRAERRRVQRTRRSSSRSAFAPARRRAQSLALDAANAQPCTRGAGCRVHVGGAVVPGVVVGPLVLVLNFLDKN